MSGTPAFTPLDQPFWDALDAGGLRMQRCTSCETWHWPPQWRCGACGGWEMRWGEVAMEGVIHSLTHTRHPFSAATVDKVPFVNLLVELPQAGGARLIGLLSGDEAGLAIGARVTGEIERTDAGPALRWSLAK